MGRRSRRHSTGFGYIGFGNNQSTFNQNAKKPFSVYKQKLDLEAHLHYKMNFLHKDLTQQEKQIIKDKIRKQERKLGQRAALVTLLLFSGIAFFTYYLLVQIMS